MHALPHFTTAPMHQCMDMLYACSLENNKVLKRNPNLTGKEQTNKKAEKKGLKSIKTDKAKAYYIKEIKKQK